MGTFVVTCLITCLIVQSLLFEVAGSKTGVDILILFAYFLMFNAAELLATSGPLGAPSHCRFLTINWPSVSSLLNDFPHLKPKEGFTLDSQEEILTYFFAIFSP